ncbi:MAG: hypothetical protein KGI29_10395 [Pseudomonadota bacterium]|nr:hypothetical protein [Pseudomonadota bacterium]MDE3036952.1 hypothetical protein [Pseudomonadota bacterium]
MADIHQYEAATALKNSISEIRKDWQQLYDSASSGQKTWLTQMKNHYAKIIQDSPEEAAELLAMYEHNFSLIRKHGFSVTEKE